MKILSSEHALRLDRLPASAIVLGGGVIGVEFASAWRSFGVDVTVVEALPRLVSGEDPSISAALERAFAQTQDQGDHECRHVGVPDHRVRRTAGASGRASAGGRADAGCGRPRAADRRPRLPGGGR